jgi:hypothetical protein
VRLAAALSLALLAGHAAAGDRLEEVGRLVLTHPDPRFGGLSGIVVREDGVTVAIVSDRGPLILGRLLREEGRLSGAELTIHTLLTLQGNPIEGFVGDAEGVAWNGTGGVLISFEGLHRIVSYAGHETKGVFGFDCPAFKTLQLNSGLEALARGPDGTVYAIPERSGAWERPFPVYRLKDGACDDRMRLPRRGPFLVTGADIGPDGRLYIVERHFALIGFAVRVRVFTISGDRLTGEETLLETPVGALDNMEGIATWRDPDGAIRLLLLSDDNFSVFQRTELVEYRLVPIAPPAKAD